jgi:hypothetical protein
MRPGYGQGTLQRLAACQIGTRVCSTSGQRTVEEHTSDVSTPAEYPVLRVEALRGRFGKPQSGLRRERTTGLERPDLLVEKSGLAAAWNRPIRLG